MRGYLGYRSGDEDTAWGGFFDPHMAALPDHVVAALHHGPQADELLLDVARAATLVDGADLVTDTGYARSRTGGCTVAVRTDMPGVTPAMWDWWFGWHGSDTRRYKLWHPRAHVSARWADGGGDGHYLGRTSLVEEYLGSAFTRAAIRFVAPGDLGLPAQERTGAVAICARLGSADLPVDIGWLVHHVRAVDGGAQMRSHFWLGGAHVQFRRPIPLSGRIIRPVAGMQLPDPRDLLVHCAQEMNHLAGFLPDLHARFA
ncbi:hypothetical protein FK535_05165 [Mycolicibacterium sp. 018/SC-01/001]|uniref:DAPG hydrolase family protein n=1 Tax=Mycolicibacterium sp. 018/SC-01/001 TaxID=2592069 RepID=UPI00117CF9A1|nr:hypothetical protein [Mycolicibacterium sp. 018/SC-01/001]TRW87833.1 hypothetical protein FK535_05165 [Mycolicibacterium sp. 018/SC-01/001]